MPSSNLTSDPEPASSQIPYSSVGMDRWKSLLIMTATLLLILGVVAIGARIVLAINHTVLLFVLGGLFAYALDPLVERLRRADLPKPRMSRGMSVLAVMVGLMLILAGAVAGLGHTLTKQIEHLSREHTMYEERAKEKLGQTDAWLAQRNVRLNLSSYISNPPDKVREWSRTFVSGALKTFEEVSKDVGEAFIVLLIAIYFLIYAEEMRKSLRASLKPPLRDFFDPFREDMNHILGGFVRGHLILGLVLGAIAAVICLSFGLRVWLIIGLFVVVTSFIPVFGPVIGAIPAIIGVVLMPSPYMAVKVIGIVVLFVIMNEVGSKVLYPRFVGGALGLHEVLVLFVLLAGLEVGGLVGVLFAAPITALAYVSLIHLYRLWQGLPPKRISPNPKPHANKMIPAALDKNP